MMYDVTPSGLIKIKRAEMRKANDEQLMSLYSKMVVSMLWGSGLTASTTKSLKAELKKRGLL